MNKAALLLTLLAACTAFSAQNPPPASKATMAYDEARNTPTEPTFGLAKVKKMIKGIKDQDDAHSFISQAAWNSLSTPEKFTYCVLHGEAMSQNCNYMPPLVNEEHLIFAHPAPAFYDQSSWGSRQSAFLAGNRGTVIQLIRQTIRSRHACGCNLTSVILKLKAKSLVPDLVALYNRDQKHQDLLSTLLTLMKNDGYKPLTSQSWYAKLYGPDASYQACIAATQKNVKIIERLALAYSKS